MEDNGDDYFSDDGFDDLPPGTLFQLEQSAYEATQARRAAQSVQHVFESMGSTPPIVAARQYKTANQATLLNATLEPPPPRLHSGLTEEYGGLDVGELDAAVLDEKDDPRGATTLQPLRAKARPVSNEDYNMGRLQREPGLMHQGNGAQLHAAVGDAMEWEASVDLGSLHEMQALVAHVQKLTRQNEELMKELAEARSVAETKAGEIAIIRSNQAKLTQQFDRQLAAARKTISDEVASHKEEIEALRAQGKMLETENAFLKQDLAEETMRIKSLKAKARAEEKEPPVTPRKPRVLPYRDGFDDDEIAAISPSKSAGGRSKRTTPTVPGKRKRKPSQDSPPQVAPLQLTPQPPLMAGRDGDADLPDHDMKDAEQRPVRVPTDDRNVRLMKQILNHRISLDSRRDIEEMSAMAFPSEPDLKLSTIVLEETSDPTVTDFPLEYARCIVSLWSRALKEKFFKPIPMFMSIVGYIISLDRINLIPALIEQLVPVLQASGDVNGVPRFTHSPVSRQNLGQIRQTPQSELQPDVDSTRALRLLYQMAYGCLHLTHVLDDFWRQIRYDFILMMLHCQQPISDIILTLNLLSTSIRSTSFGPIQDTEDDQKAKENYIVDRLANLLSEKPQVDEGREPYTQFEVCTMRLEALSLLTSIAFNPMEPNSDHGSLAIAMHPTALGRLVRAMHDELDALYSYPPERDLRSTLVNELMRLIYGVVRRHSDVVDLQSKLSRVSSGKQKFLVVFTRLAFSEGRVLEAGIVDETVEMAHEILDDAVNPEEAEALLDVFPSAKRDD